MVAVGLGLAACGHTTIVTSDKSARIYADGVYLGHGEARVGPRTGPPRPMQVTVKTPHVKIERRVAREFTVTTFVVGMFTFMTGWYWGWQYPENVVFLVPTRAEGGWDEEPSPWDSAPSGWDAGAGIKPEAAR
jgi:hypothetical protein